MKKTGTVLFYLLLFTLNTYSQTAVKPSGSGTSSSDPYLVATWDNLYWISKNDTAWGSYYKQTADIDFNDAPSSYAITRWDTSKGWTPIGNGTTVFTGTYDGDGHSISTLYISRGSENYIGFIGRAFTAVIKNLGIKDADITGGSYTGVLVGWAQNNTTISNCYSTGWVSGADSSYVGGLVGLNFNGSTISNSYSNVNVNTTSNYVGGLVGVNYFSSTISNCYSIGSVSGSSNVGGFLGYDSTATVSNCFWNSDSAGSTGIGGLDISGATAKTTSEMKTKSTFTNAGWDFDTVWDMPGQDGTVYPNLLTERIITIDNIGTSFVLNSGRKIAFKSESGNIAATFEYVNSAPSNVPSGGRTIGVYWDISNLSGSTKIRLYYDPSAVSGFTGTPTIYHYTGGNWVALLTESVGTDGSLNYVEASSYRTSFSPVTVGDNGSALPVELSEISAKVNGDKVELKWLTATEVNNYGFEIQRSAVSTQTSADSWQKIGFVKGAGNSNSPKSYSYTDQPTGGTSFSYRIKQIDNDGKFKYYDAITVNLDSKKQAELIGNYPNPFNPSTQIKFYLPETENVTIKIYDILGKEVKTLVNKQTDAGYHIVYWNGKDIYGREAASGVYVYRLQAVPSTGSGQAFTQTKKMALLK